MKFLNGIDDDADLATKKYVDDNAGAGGAAPSIAAKSLSYTFTNSDEIIVATTAGVVLTLHNAATATVKRYTLKNGSTGDISFATTSSQTVDGSTTGTIIPNQSLVVAPVAGNWVIL